MRALALSNPAARLLADRLPPKIAALLAEDLEYADDPRAAFLRWFNNPDFSAPLTSSIVPSKGAGPGTFTRATVRTSIDHEAKVNNLLAGEVPFYGARRVHNLVGGSSANLAAAGYASRNGHVVGAQDGTGLCPITVTAAAAGANNGVFNESQITSDSIAGTYTFRLRVIAGTINRIDICVKDRATDTIRGSALNIPVAAGAGTVITVTGVGVTTAGARTEIQANGGGSGTFWAGEWQVECVTGAVNQNPSEHVTFGVLATPWYGAGVDGVRCFEFYNGNSVAANILTAGAGAPIGLNTNNTAVNLIRDATSGFSTPDTVANSITGSIDLRFYGAGAFSTMAATGLVQKDAVANNRCYALQVGAIGAGKLRFFYTTDGATPRIADSTVVLPTACDSQPTWLRATYNAATGDVTFYYSLDYSATWVQLGAVVTITAGAIFDGTSSLWVGAQPTSVNAFLGTIYKACVYSGINGVLVACFDPNDYVTGATFVSSVTRETWTLNGTSTIRNSPLAGYLEETVSTNLVLQSENFGVTWAAVGTPTRVAAQTRCGSVVLDLIGDDDAAALEGYTQLVTFTGDGVKGVSLFIAQGTSTSTWVNINSSTGPTDRLSCNITWANGVPTATMVIGTLLGIDALANGVFRVRLASGALVAAELNTLRIFPSSVTGTTAPVGNLYVGGVQAENNTVCSSYIPTAAATVTRNTDLLTYPTAGNIIDAAGTAYCEFAATANIAGNTRLIGTGAATTPLAFGGTTVTVVFDGANGSNSNAVATMLNGVTHKTASTWTTAGPRMIASLDGGLGAAVALYNGAMVGASGSFGVGCIPAGTLNLNGTIRNVRLWKAANFDSYIQRATA